MKEALFSICVTAVITAVYKAFTPGDRFGSQIKLLISCFFVLTVINAVTGVVNLGELPEITLPDTPYRDYSAQVNDLAEAEIAAELKARIAAELAEENISPEKIYINVNIENNGSIFISEIGLVFSRSAYERDAERAVAVTRRCVGASVKITAEISSQSG